MAASAAMNHSGELQPSIATPWCNFRSSWDWNPYVNNNQNENIQYKMQ